MASAGKLHMYGESGAISQEQLVQRHGVLVKRIAHHLLARMPSSVQVDDLIQAGLIGLLEAARSFDGSKGASFETFAGIRIRGAMIDELRRGDWAPRSVHRNQRRISDAIRQVEARLGRDANDEEVAREMQIPLSEYHDLLSDSVGARLFSIEDLSEQDEDALDRVASDEANPLDHVQQESMRKQLIDEIGKLPERERMVLALYYDEELNLKEIGLVLGVTESRVSQIHSQAAMRLRSRLAGWLTTV